VKLRKDARRLQQDSPATLDRGSVVRCVHLVFVERRGVLEFIRPAVDGDVDVHLGQQRHQLVVEGGHRTRPQRQRADLAVADADDQVVIDEVEIELERPRPYGMGEVVKPRALT
jgi:hypothetical protein